jgi:hypothetical protein
VSSEPGAGHDAELKHALAVPKDENAAAAQLRRFYDYTARVGEELIHAGGNRRSRPKPGSVPFFVSYFWQVQQRDLWPVYYTNSVQVIAALNLWEETGEVGNDYLSYKRLHDALVELFSKTAGRAFSLYDVEHVFWFTGGKPIKGYERDSEVKTGTRHEIDRPKTGVDLSDSYLPPVVAIIPALASNDPSLRDAASEAGTTIDRALEKSCNAALTILGYETKLLGQGKGRVPDGQAIAPHESYALLWDAKVREGGYSMGTDDRTIREYIGSQSRELKRRGLRNIYYVIISSGFTDEFDDLIRTLKMDTDVSEVCLLEATALVEIVNQRLRSPLTITLGSDGLQRLFCVSGKISVDDVIESLES